MKRFVKVNKRFAAAWIVLLEKLEKYSAELRIVQSFDGASHALNPSNVLVEFTQQRAYTFDDSNCMTATKGCFPAILRPLRIERVVGGGNFFKGEALGVYDVFKFSEQLGSVTSFHLWCDV